MFERGTSIRRNNVARQCLVDREKNLSEATLYVLQDMDSDNDDDDDSITLNNTPVTRYEGEDTSPTTDRELQGWYCYGVAAEVFAVVGVGSFLPVTMEQLARERGVLWSDRSAPCISRGSGGGHPSVRAEGAGVSNDKDQCLIKFLGAEMTTSSFVMYTSSIAVFVQALTLVSLSTFADHGNNRKRLLLIFAFTGAATAMSFTLVTPAALPFGSLLAIVAITCLGCSLVMLNSFLPLLTTNHPIIRDVRPDTTNPTSTPDVLSAAAKLSNRISSRGVALGYGNAVFVQVLAIIVLILASRFTASKTLPLRSILFLTGVWWAVFTIPTYVFLRSRPGPPLPAKFTKTSTYSNTTSQVCLSYVTYAWFSLYGTLHLALSLRQLRLFLLAWFLLSDAIATVGTTAILFARTSLALPPAGIAALSVTATLSGITGALVWPILSHRYQLATNKTIVYCMIMMEIVPLYGLLGYLPPVQRLGFLGLQQSWEIFPLAVIYGIAQGGLSSYCRSFFGQLIPLGHEAAFYALFAITDKGSSAIGPAIVGMITDATGSIRPAFIFLLFLIGLPILLVRKVDEKKGSQEAEAASWTLAHNSREENIELDFGPAATHNAIERERLMAED